jgi:hypothetical protein
VCRVMLNLKKAACSSSIATFPTVSLQPNRKRFVYLVQSERTLDKVEDVGDSLLYPSVIVHFSDSGKYNHCMLRVRNGQQKLVGCSSNYSTR